MKSKIYIICVKKNNIIIDLTLINNNKNDWISMKIFHVYQNDNYKSSDSNEKKTYV